MRTQEKCGETIISVGQGSMNTLPREEALAGPMRETHLKDTRQGP